MHVWSPHDCFARSASDVTQHRAPLNSLHCRTICACDVCVCVCVCVLMTPLSPCLQKRRFWGNGRQGQRPIVIRTDVRFIMRSHVAYRYVSFALTCPAAHRCACAIFCLLLSVALEHVCPAAADGCLSLIASTGLSCFPTLP